MTDTRPLPHVLSEVVSQFGRRIVDRPAQLRAALSDTYGSAAPEHVDEVTAAVTASTVGVAAAIRDADPAVPAERAQIQAWFDELVAAGLSLRDAALATSSWASAFSAAGTARASSELSEELLGGGEPPVDEAPERTQTTGPSDHEVTLLGAETPEDLTEHVPVAAPRPSRHDAPAPVPLASYPPPAGPVILPLDQPDGKQGRSPGSSWLRNWWPATLAVAAVVVTTAVCVPAIVANTAAPEPAANAEPVAPNGPSQFWKGDTLQFLLTDAELQAAVPGGTLEGLWTPTEEVAQRYRSADGTPWELETGSTGCDDVLRYVPPVSRGFSSAALVNGVYDGERIFESVARAYTDEERAREALSLLAAGSECQNLEVRMQGGVFPATFETLEQAGPDRLHDRLDFGNFAITRRCAVRLNVVSCLYGSRVATSTGVDEVDGRPIWTLVTERAAEAAPFDPRGGDR